MKAITCIAPPQRGHVRGSTSKTRACFTLELPAVAPPTVQETAVAGSGG
ncbi:MAG: hypothetical protein ABSF26_16170 [Thermoguttaceae bacterium]